MMVPAFTGLGAPYWKPDARGTITGLTRGTTVAHIARAALESIAYQSAALLQAMSRDAVAAGAAPVAELRVDGGACVNDLLMQFQADLLGIPVVRPAVTETTALGAAYLAGLSSGVYRSTEELSQLWQAERRFLPTLDAGRAAELMARLGARGAAGDGWPEIGGQAQVFAARGCRSKMMAFPRPGGPSMKSHHLLRRRSRGRPRIARPAPRT